jgi:carboxyl-terminal processing protease
MLEPIAARRFLSTRRRPSHFHPSRWVGLLQQRVFSLCFGAICVGAAGGCGSDVTPDIVYDCSIQGRKGFVADVMSDYYLWSDRVPEVDLAALATPEEVMRAMTFAELDHWSGMQRQAERSAFFDQGRFQGLGYTLGQDLDGGLRISWVHEGSSAGRAGLDRGALILALNGLAVEGLSNDQINAELGRDIVTHTILELDGTEHDVELAQGDVTITSVKDTTVLDTPEGPVGYLMFTTFVLPGEDELRAAFSTFRERGVSRLVIDLRYNGGGLLRTAALLGSLIAANAAGRPLIVETYNAHHGDLNRERLMFETPEAINATHVVFLTTGRTASASEQVINGLRPYLDVDVVGGTTLGKPVGADSWDHCEYTLAPITFHSLNAAGEGDYFQGIEPECFVDDDLLHRLGDPHEAQLGAGLRVLAGQPCAGPAAEPLAEDAAPTDSEKALTPAARIGSDRLPTLARVPRRTLPGRFPDLPGWY